MNEIYPLLDEVFGTSAKAPAPLLAGAARTLSRHGHVELWLTGAGGRLIAYASSHDPTGLAEHDEIPSVPEYAHATVQVSADNGFSIVEVELGSFLFELPLRGSECPRGRLTGRISHLHDRQRLTERWREIRGWLNAAGELALLASRAEDKLSRERSRVEQLQRQYDLFLAEHRRIIALNLDERNSRLSEQQNYLMRLEMEVAERTSELRQQAAELKSRNAELEEARSLAEVASRTKSSFLANVSHEVRTPLTAILGFADLLEEGELDHEEREDAIARIRQSGRHLLAIINDVLDISKVEAGKMTVERHACSPSRVLLEIRDLIGPKAEAKGIHLDFHLEGPLPLVIESDPVRLKQVIVNLVDNAVKFTHFGHVRVLIHCDVAKEKLYLSVIDEGIGIPAEALASIFEPFVQADSSCARKYGGTGLGLSIARQVARLLGGDLSATSVEGHGSIFDVFVSTGPLEGIPMLDAIDWRAPCATPRIRQGHVPRLHGRVLVVEDGIDNQRLLEHQLKKAGADVVVVEDGKAAIDAVRDSEMGGRPFDLVLMDMQMPVMSGYDATKRLRELEYRLPVIALTAHAMEGEREKCLAAGCDAYLTKPIDRRRLLVEVARRIHGPPNGE